MSTEQLQSTVRTCIFTKLHQSLPLLEWAAVVKQRTHRQRGVIRVSAYFRHDRTTLELRGPEWLSEQQIIEMCSEENSSGILNVVRSYNPENELVVLGLVYQSNRRTGEAVCSRDLSFVESVNVKGMVDTGTPPVTSPSSPYGSASPDRRSSPAPVEVSS